MGRFPGRGPTAVFIGLIFAFVALSLSISIATPPWEANDEPDHVRNVQTLVAGDLYRIEPGAGFEAHQAPLYYYALAGMQLTLGIAPRPPMPEFVPFEAGTQGGIFRHDTPMDGADQRLVGLLRLPGILFGVVTLLFIAATARLISTDPWTPVVASAIVVGVPKFVFLSSVVNNDNLANTVGAALVFATVATLLQPPAVGWRRLGATTVLGVLVGLLLITKVSSITVALGVLPAVWFLGNGLWSRLRLLMSLAVGVLLSSGWWLVQNQVRYGDPVGAAASREHLMDLFPPLFAVNSAIEQAFRTIPGGVYETFWYVSGWNQFSWPWWGYLPFWIGIIAALSGIAVRCPRPRPPRPLLVVLAFFVIGAFSAIWIVGIETSTFQGRLAFTGLAALAVLAALGLERYRLPPLIRFAAPVIGFVATLIALRLDVLNVYML